MQKSRDVYSLDIPMGTSITCLLNKTEKIITRVVGYEQDNFIIMKFPVLAGIKSYLVERASFAAHLNVGSSSIFFSSHIDAVLERKFIALCQYPSVFKVFDMRLTKRVDCLVPAGIMLNDCYYYGVLKDLSDGGCHFILDAVRGNEIRKAAAGDMLTLEMGPLGDTIMITGEVMHSRSNLARTTLGIAFRGMDARDKARLNNYLQHLLCNQLPG